MAKKKYLDMLDGVEIYKQSRSHTESRIAAEVTNKLGQANGIATLGGDGKVPAAQLPSYVDDVVEGYLNPADGHFYKDRSGSAGSYTYSNQITGEANKIYVDLATEKTYRCSNTTSQAFVVISETLALGETSSTAYRGDRGKTAYDHATETGRLTTAKTEKLYKVSVTAEGHVGSATEVTKGDLTGKGVEDASNKVSAWSSTTTDTNYPSEKLVKDSLDGKADKVASATNGHFAGLDANGNLTDSGKALADLVAKLIVGDSSAITVDSVIDVEDPVIALRQDGAIKSAHTIKGGSNIKVEWDADEHAIVITNTYNPEAHYQAKNIVGGSATAKANAQVTGIDGVYLNLVENDTVRSSHKIVGAKTANGVSKIQVNSDSNGNITLDMGIASTSEMAGAISAWEAAEATTPGSGDTAAEAYVAQVEAA